MKVVQKTLSVAAMTAMVSVAWAQDAKKAPDFTGTDQNGKTHSLADYKGKIVVLEFTNPGSPVTGKAGCPYMVPRYESKAIQNLAASVQKSGGVYLGVNSGHYNTAADSKAIAEKYGVTHPMLVDSSGTIAKAFQAKTTPHVFVINKEGNIIYDGALNSNATPDVSKDAAATNYVEQAVAAANKGELPATTRTKPYGCGVHLAK